MRIISEIFQLQNAMVSIGLRRNKFSRSSTSHSVFEGEKNSFSLSKDEVLNSIIELMIFAQVAIKSLFCMLIIVINKMSKFT